MNARLAGLTVAFALDFNTAGERLTHKAAEDRYVAIRLECDPIEAAEILVGVMRAHHVRILNIAGNGIFAALAGGGQDGIYSLHSRGWPQERVNAFVHQVLSLATRQWPVKKVLSGGQTGVDIAGVTAAYALGILAEATLPKGFIQRGPDNRDRRHEASEIRTQIESGAAKLRTQVRAGEPRLYNIKRDKFPDDVIYIGRGTWRGQKSKLGNPFVIGPDGDRNEVCDRFAEWAPNQPEIMQEIEKYRGRSFACYCTPYRCHGNWILKMANRELAVAPTPSPAHSEFHIQFNPQI